MDTNTVKELREIARDLGITGFSKMRKEELLAAIKKAKPKKKAATKSPKTKKAAKVKKAKKKITKGKVRKTVMSAEPVAKTVKREPTEETDEERIESAKFITTIAGTAAYHSQYPPDLGEDIDTLPPLPEPRLTFLMQKPGVVATNWHLESGRTQQDKDLRLRLGVLADQQFHIEQEVQVNTDRGSHYFHIDPSWPPAVIYLQLGHYDQNGRFVIAIRRGTVRLPRLFIQSSLGVNWALEQEEFEREVITSGPLGSWPQHAIPGAPSSHEWITSGAITSSGLIRKG